MVATNKLYTPETANRALPLVRAIARDVCETALRMQATWKKLEAGGLGAEGRQRLQDSFDEGRGRLLELNAELEALGVELKDPLQGLLDFRAMRNGAEVYLCWELDEAEVGHWHPLDAGYGGRQSIETF
jgi:hypothetical protein